MDIKVDEITNLEDFALNGYNVIRWGSRPLSMDVLSAVREPSNPERDLCRPLPFMLLAGVAVSEEIRALEPGDQLFNFTDNVFKAGDKKVGVIMGMEVYEQSTMPANLLACVWVDPAENKIVGHIGSWILTKGLSLKLPDYKSVKIVAAAEIITMEDVFGEHEGPVALYLDNKRISVSREWYNKHAPHTGGFYVVYGNGYTSFCPKEEFLKGNHRIEENEETRG